MTNPNLNPFASLGKPNPKPKPQAKPTLHGLKTTLTKSAQSTRGITRDTDSLTLEKVTAALAPVRQADLLEYGKTLIAELKADRAGSPDQASGSPNSPSSDQTPGIANPFLTHSNTTTNYTLDESQQLAITTALTNRYMNLVGCAGSGKTFTTSQVISALISAGKIRTVSQATEDLTTRNPSASATHTLTPSHIGLTHRSFNLACVAFTGMAVKNIRRNLPRALANNCSTIHKLLDYGPVIVEQPATAKDIKSGKAHHIGQLISKKIFVPRITSENPLNLDFLLIDEASMLGLNLAEQLFSAISPHTRVLIVGDPSQLKPVMDTSIQPFTLSAWPTVNLTKIYRQKDGDIIDAATRIRHGKPPATSPNFTPRLLDQSPVKAQHQIRDFISKSYADGTYNPFLDIALSPWNKAELGTTILNSLTRTIVNPSAKRKLIKTQTSNLTYSVGDRVAITKNNAELGVYNGMLGTIIKINPNRKLDYDPEAEPEASTMTNPADPAAGSHVDFDALTLAAEANSAAILASPTGSTANSEGDGSRQATHTVHIALDEDVLIVDEKWLRDNLVTYLADNPGATIPHIENHLAEVIQDTKSYPDLTQASTALSTSSSIENTMLAYWVTVNRAQGSGFRNVILAIHGQHAVSLCNELLYTGVTRTKNSVTPLITKYAIGKCLNRFTYVGDTLEEKVSSYIAEQLAKGKEIDHHWLPEPQADDDPEPMAEPEPEPAAQAPNPFANLKIKR